MRTKEAAKGPGRDSVRGRRRLILYVDGRSGKEGQRLQEKVSPVFADTPQEICPDFDNLAHRLRQPVRYGHLEIYVLLADTVTRLQQLHSLVCFLEDKKTLLIIPNEHKTTYMLGFRLYPRYVTSIHTSYEDVCSVLAEMLRQKRD